MRYFLDTEFYEDGKTVELISLGIACEDGRGLYAVLDGDWSHVNDWVKENVLPHLDPPGVTLPRVSRDEARDAILAFVGDDEKPEFWAYYADYDWVVMCQLFGRMIDLPKHFPKFCMDLKQECVRLGNPDLKKAVPQENEHNAIADALWNARVFSYLSTLK